MVFQFKIELEGSSPKIWRRVVIPANYSFEKLHDIIQHSFGWENQHLAFFSPSGYGSKPVISVQEDNNFQEQVISSKVVLQKVFTKEKQTFIYIYDFGDDWTHKITLEKILPESNIIAARCTAGKGACPPEHCGGIAGYYNILEIAKDKKSPDYESIREWLGLEEGEEWDVNKFKL